MPSWLDSWFNYTSGQLFGKTQQHFRFDIISLEPNGPQDEAGVKKAASECEFYLFSLLAFTVAHVWNLIATVSVLEMVEKEVNAGIPSNRIMIGGFSQGGATALYTAVISKQPLAGVLALSSWLPLHTKVEVSFFSIFFTKTERFEILTVSVNGNRE